jgi:hypothetical protein
VGAGDETSGNRRERIPGPLSCPGIPKLIQHISPKILSGTASAAKTFRRVRIHRVIFIHLPAHEGDFQLHCILVIADLAKVGRRSEWDSLICHDTNKYSSRWQGWGWLMERIEEIFALGDSDTLPPVPLASLATTLGVPVTRLIPLVSQGYLRAVDPPAPAPPVLPVPSGHTLISPPNPRALLWLRNWFQPAHAKLLFSLADAAALLEITVPDALILAESHQIPLMHDPALGFMLSTRAMKGLILKALGSRLGRVGDPEGVRFDRVSMIWAMMKGDPAEALRPPRYSEELERELQRVAKLTEPTRTQRMHELWDALRDCAELVKVLRAGKEG